MTAQWCLLLAIATTGWICPHGLNAAPTHYYQLYCGPTPEHRVHGCGYYKTKADCMNAARPNMGYTECVKEEIQVHSEEQSD